ncbi:casein kinase-like protein I isoform alpha [Fomes fomentarius]|nr:casein kinase-like protein I isoform alpha [Fomes fomentarius]
MSFELVNSFTVCGIYQVIMHIGSGGAGDVWKAFCILTNQLFALKMEGIPVDRTTPLLLQYEAIIYRFLAGAPEGIPQIHWSGIDGNHFVMVMDLLGPNLRSLQRLCRGAFTLRSICMLAEQMGLFHATSNPQNFAMGFRENVRIVHLFDFSHAQLFVNSYTNAHIPFRLERSTMGTLRYAKVSRGDDIESLLYVLMELYHGSLPWHDVSADDHQERTRIVHEMKAGKVFHDFLSQSLPEFGAYYSHCSALLFGERPDYLLLKGLFRTRMRSEGWLYDSKFDWEDGVNLEKGTLVPEDYVFDMRFVERHGLDPV